MEYGGAFTGKIYGTLLDTSRTRSGGTGNHKGIRYFLSFLFLLLAFFFCDEPRGSHKGSMSCSLFSSLVLEAWNNDKKL